MTPRRLVVSGGPDLGAGLSSSWFRSLLVGSSRHMHAPTDDAIWDIFHGVYVKADYETVRNGMWVISEDVLVAMTGGRDLPRDAVVFGLPLMVDDEADPRTVVLIDRDEDAYDPDGTAL